MEKVQILNKEKTFQKITRIAYQIFEQNFDEKEIIIAGIKEQGLVLSNLIAEKLQEIAHFKVFTAEVQIDKSIDFQSDIEIKSEVSTFKNKSVILVDDVLHTGKTLAFCLRPFLSIPLKKLQVAVLVDRGHHKYPIEADYIGYRLSTTLKDHVKVELNSESEIGVYVF